MITTRSITLSFLSVLLSMPLLMSNVNPFVVFAVAVVINIALAYQVEKVWPSKKAPAPVEPERSSHERL